MMVLCEICNISYDGRVHKTGCPKCKDENFKLREEIANKEVEIDQLNKSLLEPKAESQNLVGDYEGGRRDVQGDAGVYAEHAADGKGFNHRAG